MHRHLSIFNFRKKLPREFYILIILIVIFEILLSIIGDTYFLSSGIRVIIFKRKEIKSKNINADIIFVGDSRCMSGVNAKSLGNNIGKKVYNLAIPNSGLGYITPLLKKYLKYNKKPKSVVISVMPNTISGKWELPHPITGYHLSYLLSLKEVFSVTKKKDSFQIMKYYFNFIPSIKYLVGVNKTVKRIFDEEKFLKLHQIKKEILFFKETNGQMIFDEEKPILDKNGIVNDTDYLKTFKIDKNTDKALKRSFLFLKKNNIDAYLLIMPYPNGAKGSLDKNHLFVDYERYIKNLETTGFCRYIPTLRSLPDEYFSDPSHLNSKGSEKFTIALRDICEILNIK